MKKANICRKCGKVFIGNKCPNCGTEILPETPKSKRTETDKEKEKGEKEVREFRY